MHVTQIQDEVLSVLSTQGNCGLVVVFLFAHKFCVCVCICVWRQSKESQKSKATKKINKQDVQPMKPNVKSIEMYWMLLYFAIRPVN